MPAASLLMKLLNICFLNEQGKLFLFLSDEEEEEEVEEGVGGGVLWRMDGVDHGMDSLATEEKDPPALIFFFLLFLYLLYSLLINIKPCSLLTASSGHQRCVSVDGFTEVPFSTKWKEILVILHFVIWQNPTRDPFTFFFFLQYVRGSS